MKSIDFKNFDLQSVAINSKNKLKMKWYDMDNKNDLLGDESDSTPSEDLIECIKKFNKAMAVSLDLTKGFEFAREHNRKNEETLKKAVHGCLDEHERCTIKQITFVGSDEFEGIRIKGNLLCDSGTVPISSTPLIKFVDDEAEEGFSEYLEEICNTLKKEVFAFIYKGKRANDLFTEKKEVESGLNNTNLKAV